MFRRFVNSNSTSTTTADASDNIAASDKLQQIHANLEDVKQIVKDDVETAMLRDEKLETLQHNTNSLQDSAVMFVQATTQLKRQVEWTHYLTSGIAIATAIVIILLL